MLRKGAEIFIFNKFLYKVFLFDNENLKNELKLI